MLLQSFRDVEFILVDDGSTDRSGIIAESYVDEHFHVFHTCNSGLSAARNYGISQSRGEWIMFVDSDDWIDPEFCSIPYRAALDNDADLVIFRAYEVRKMAYKKIKKVPIVGIVDAETATKFGEPTVWNKLYKRELFEKIQYPEGKVFEDIFTTHNLVFAAKRIVMLNDALYYHVIRKDSISHTYSEQFKNDAVVAAMKRAKELKSFGCSRETYEPMLWFFAMGYLARTYPNDSSAYKISEEVVNSIEGLPKELPLQKRIMLMVWRADKCLFHFICRILKQKDPKYDKK